MQVKNKFTETNSYQIQYLTSWYGGGSREGVILLQTRREMGRIKNKYILLIYKYYINNCRRTKLNYWKRVRLIMTKGEYLWMPTKRQLY